MPDAHLTRVKLEYPDLPVTILIVLPPQRGERASAVISRLDTGRQQDLSSRFPDSKIVLIILIPDHLLIKWTRFFNDLACVSRKGDRVGVHFAIVNSSKTRSADTKPRTHRSSDRAGPYTFTYGLD